MMGTPAQEAATARNSSRYCNHVLPRLAVTAGSLGDGQVDAALLMRKLAFIAWPGPRQLARPLGSATFHSGLDQCEYRPVQTGGEQDLPPAPLLIGGLRRLISVLDHAPGSPEDQAGEQAADQVGDQVHRLVHQVGPSARIWPQS